MQGAPAANMIAAKAAALGYAMSAAFDACMAQIRSTADEMAKAFQAKDYEVVGGCSENHTVLVRLRGGITGAIAEAALGHCGIIVSKHRVPDDPRSALVTSGLRIGTAALAQRRVDVHGSRQMVDLIVRILNTVAPLGEQDYTLEPLLLAQFRSEVETLCRDYPLADYQ
jgi:glycine hydroxymethyltransferase